MLTSFIARCRNFLFRNYNMQKYLENIMSPKLDRIYFSQAVRTDTHEVLTKLFNDQYIYLDTRDISIAPHLMMEGMWERHITDVFLKIIQPDTVFFDIGANFGYFGLLAGKYINPAQGGKIVFFEPNHCLTEKLRKSIAVNGMRGYTLLSQLAVANKSMTAELNVPVNDLCVASLHSQKKINEYMPFDTVFDKSINIQTISLDEFTAMEKIEKVDFIKLDIEGFEEAAYVGMKQVIKKNPQLKLLIEFTLQGYKDPEKFYHAIKTDFQYIYAINEDSSLKTLHDYIDLKTIAQENKDKGSTAYAMILTSNCKIQF